MTDWDAIVEEHGPLVAGISWRILGNAADVEDNVQEVFVAAWQIEAAQPISHWRGLLRKLATLHALARLRRRKPQASINNMDLAGAGQSPDAEVIAEELELRLRQAVANLPEREAAVFTLRFFEQLDLRAICQTLDIGYAAAAKALSRARSKLEQAMGGSNLEAR